MTLRFSTHRPLALVGLTAAALILTACGGGESSTSQQTTTPATQAPAGEDNASSDEPTESEPEPAADTEGATAHTLVKSGFGFADPFAWVSALVSNDSVNSGATVTVNFNLLDDAGAILVSGSQVEAFSRPDELLVLGTQLEVPAGTVPSSLEATVQVEYPGIGSTEPFPELPLSPVTIARDEFGGWEASATLTNPTDQPLNGPRIGIICLDAAGQIIGGSSSFPDLVPPSGQVRVDSLFLTLSGDPAACEMYAGAPL